VLNSSRQSFLEDPSDYTFIPPYVVVTQYLIKDTNTFICPLFLLIFIYLFTATSSDTYFRGNPVSDFAEATFHRGYITCNAL